jgi:FkbM family methyltransferase
MTPFPALKSAIKHSGLYPLARHWYRRTAPSARRERAALRRFYGQLIEPGDLCFDIGANVGQTTEALVDCGARVIAVEPNPQCIPILRWQFGRDPRVTLVQKAIGAAGGSVTLNFRGTESTASVLADWPFGNNESQTVELTTLDDLISQFGRPRLCKVDVEGYEVEVFKGLSQAIPIIDFEIHPGALHWAREVLKRLSTIGRITAADIAAQHHGGWIFPDWVGLEEFHRRLEAKPAGMEDAVIRMFDGISQLS